MSDVANAGSDPHGACVVARIAPANSTNITVAKSGPGRLYSFFVEGTAGAANTAFIKFFDSAVTPVIGTTPVLFTVPVISTASVPGWAEFECDPGIQFVNGISYAITGAVADNDTTAVAANCVHGAFFYK